MTRPLLPPPRRVLLIRPRGLGDVVLASAVIDAVGRAYPEAAIDFLSSSPSRALLETDERLQRVFLLSKTPARGGRVESGRMREAIAWMRRLPADLLLDLFSNPKTAVLTALSGARVRAGLARSVRQFAYNVRIPRFLGRPEDETRWSRDVMLDFARAAGVVWTGDARLSVALTAQDRDFAERFVLGLGSRTKWAAVLPGGSWESKRWSAEGFAAVARALAPHLGAPVVVVWGPPEESDARRIVELAPESARLAPPSTIREMAAVLEHAAVLVTTDCLGRHLAIARGVPTVGVFGSTNPLHWTPREGPHRTIGGKGTPFAENLRSLPADPVIDAALLLLLETGEKHSSSLDAPLPRA